MLNDLVRCRAIAWTHSRVIVPDSTAFASTISFQCKLPMIYGRPWNASSRPNVRCRLTLIVKTDSRKHGESPNRA